MRQHSSQGDARDHFHGSEAGFIAVSAAKEIPGVPFRRSDPASTSWMTSLSGSTVGVWVFFSLVPLIRDESGGLWKRKTSCAVNPPFSRGTHAVGIPNPWEENRKVWFGGGEYREACTINEKMCRERKVDSPSVDASVTRRSLWNECAC